MNPYNGFSGAQRSRAIRWLRREYEAGRRSPPRWCDACGQTEGWLQAHSEDYSEPFGAHIGAYGLCYTCHMVIHCRDRAPEKWAEYRRRIRNGWMAKPITFSGPNWAAIRQYLWGDKDLTWIEQTAGSDLLDRIGTPSLERWIKP